LAEEIRDLLLQAAYVELLKAESDGIFATDAVAGFTLETVRRLRRHKFPFAGALKVVAIDGLRPTPADPKYQRLAQTRPDQLDRRFQSIKSRLGELLPQYVEAAAHVGRAFEGGASYPRAVVVMYPTCPASPR
jgi:hypothetical protein